MAENVETKEELNLDKKVTVRSIAGWTVGFQRKYDGIGDVNIAPHGTARLSRNEIIAQVQSGNNLFLGTDKLGSHATLYIEDDPTRIECGFDSEDGSVKQNVLTEKKVADLFKVRTEKAFINEMKETVVTRAEKHTVMEIVRKLGLNDYAKIRAIEEHTGIKL